MTIAKIQTNFNNYQLFQIYCHQVSFLITGLLTTLGVQWLYYRGAANSVSFLPQLSGYTGMLLVGCFVPVILKNKKELAAQYKLIIKSKEEEEDDFNYHDKQKQALLDNDSLNDHDEPKLPVPSFIKEEGPIPHFSIIKLAFLDILSSFALNIGFSIIGSGMYQVIYSSVVVWCAILTWLIMDRSLSRFQWLAIIGTSVGLGLSSLGSFQGSSIETETEQVLSVSMNQEEVVITEQNTLLQGTLMTLVGTFISACLYVYSDTILSKNDKQPLPARVCCWMGFYTSIFTWIWIVFYTVPRFNEMIHIDESTSVSKVVWFYIMITLANAIHSWNYYELIERTGNVATGILQGLRAIFVYGLSHIWFCQEDQAQCFTVSKGCGSIIVIGSVLIFTLGKSKTV